MKKRLLILGFILMNIFAFSALKAQNVFVWDGNSSNLSGTAWSTFLTNQGYAVTYPAVNSPLPTDYSAYDAVFLNFGIYSNNHGISSAEAQSILDYANAGGKVYIEGGDIFYYDEGGTILQTLSGMGSSGTDGDNIVPTINGITGTLTDGMSFSNYTGGNNFIDIMAPVSSTGIFIADDAGGGGGEANECRGIQWDNGTYKVVAISFELGGLVDGVYPNTKNELMTRIVNFLDIVQTYAPRNLTATAGAGEVELSWSMPALQGGFQQYLIYYGTSPNPTVLMDSTEWDNIEDTYKLITGLLPSTTYYFRVTTLHDGIESEYSNEVSAKPFSPPVGIIVTTTNDDGEGSLRWAIDSANITPQKDTISFNVDLIGSTISPMTALPNISKPIYINGDINEDGQPDIQIDGISLSWANMLTIRSSHNVIKGLVLTGTRQTNGAGIALIDTSSHDNLIIGNYIGVDMDGSTINGNIDGIYLGSGTYRNSIGDGTFEGRNVIAGNQDNNINLSGSHQNIIQGNYFGIDPDGNPITQFTSPNIRLYYSNNNQIGGNKSGQGNYICGGFGQGLTLQNSNYNLIAGNSVGITPTGAVHGNSSDGGTGIGLNQSRGNQIGDGTYGGRNIISGNPDGINISDQSDSTRIIGNFIGTDFNGTSAVGNNDGLIIIDSREIQIGDGTFMGRNVISGNYVSGISTGSSSVIGILGNFIGVDSTGDASLPNQSSGISVGAMTDSLLIGHDLPFGRNIISGNNGNGIEMYASDFPINKIRIMNNYIGTDVTGTLPVPNSGDGIYANSNGAPIRIDSIAFNRIAFNNNNGISLNGMSVDSVLMFNNSIHHNSGSGIYLDGSAQGGIPSPSIDNYIGNTIYGSGAGTTTMVQIYTDTEDEGQYFQGTTYGFGEGTWEFTLPSGLPPNTNVTALISTPGGRTSAFSSPYLINTNHLIVSKTADDTSIGTLRHAITWANNSIGADTIKFMPLTTSIVINQELPSIVDSHLVIDGDINADNIPDIEVTGKSSFAGISIYVSNVHINGLIINGFGYEVNTQGGIVFSGPMAYNNQVTNCYIGTNKTGTEPFGNSCGILVFESANNQIGPGNVISGNNYYGIKITAADSRYNRIIGNYIGTDKTGLDTLKNSTGIYLEYAENTSIGDGTANGRNIISGNETGIGLWYARNNSISGNIIGLNKNGNAALGNSNYGISLSNSKLNMIGEKSGLSNVITGNGYTAIYFNSSDSNSVLGNIIGLDMTGQNTIADNFQDGIFFSRTGKYNNIGDGTVTGRNIISGNSIGISFNYFLAEKETENIIKRPPGFNAITGNVIAGNYVGTDITGTVARPNTTGIYFYNNGGPTLNISYNLIGGGTTDSGNVISGNQQGMIFHNVDSNIVSNNFIGTNESLTQDLGNTANGIILTGLYSSGGGPSWNDMKNKNKNITESKIAFPKNAEKFSGIEALGGSSGNYFNNNVIAYNDNTGITAQESETMGNNFSINRFYENGNPINIINYAQNGILPPDIYNMNSDYDLFGYGDIGAGIFIYADSSGNPQGRIYLDSTTVNSDGEWQLNVPYYPGWHYRALQELNGNTSEFSSPYLPMLGTLVTDPAVMNFGNIFLNDTVTQVLKLYSENGIVNANSFSLDFFEHFYIDSMTGPNQMGPGDTMRIYITFHSESFGAFTDNLNIQLLGATDTIRVPLNGQCAGGLVTATPANLDFGSVQVNSSSQRRITLKVSPAPVLIADYVTSQSDIFIVDSVIGSTYLFPEDSLVMYVSFNPLTADTLSEFLYIIGNSAGGDTLVIPLSASSFMPVLAVMPSSVNFGGVQLSDSAEQILKIYPLLGDVLLSSGNLHLGTQFQAELPNFPYVINSGDTLTIPLKFKPTLIGEASDTLRLYNNTDINPINVVLTGTGFNTGITASPADLIFGDVLVSDSMEILVTVKPVAGTVIVSGGFFDTGSPFSAVLPSFPDTLFLGDSLLLPVKFVPTDTGSFSDVLRLNNNSDINPLIIAMSGRGTVIPEGELYADLTNINFGPVLAGGMDMRAVKLTAALNSVTIDSIKVYDGTHYGVIPSQSIPFTIGLTDTLMLDVHFMPQTFGTFSDSVLVYNNSAASPLVIRFTGQGIAGTLSASTGNLNFGTRLVGDSVDASVVFKASTGMVQISQITQGIGGAIDFKVANAPSVPRILHAGIDSMIVTMRFKPVSAGAKVDTLKIYDNSSANESLVFLTGTATINQAPNVFALKSPTGLALINDRTPDFSWEGKGDPDGDALTYIIDVSKLSDFSTIAYRDTTADTIQTAETQLDTLGIYYWRVTALDGRGGSTASNTGSFRIDAKPAVLTAGTFFSTITKQYLSVNVISDKLMTNVQGKIVLRSAANIQIDSVVKTFDLESAANKFYQTPYKLASAGKLFVTVTGTDSAQNITTVAKNYTISTLAKEQTLAMNSDDGHWQITAPKRTVDEDGFLMVNELSHETVTLKDQSVTAMAKISGEWTMIGDGLNIQGTAPIRSGQGFMVTLRYDETTIAELQSRYSDYDERKIGMYAEVNGEWTYIGGEGRNGQVQAKMKDYGRVKLMYNPEHEFLPTKVELAQNYPNPFNPTTTIRFGVPQEGKVKLVIYNVLGQKVKELVNDSRTAGYHTMIWSGRSDNGHIVSSGVYLYRLETPQGTAVKKMMFVK